MLFQKIRNRWGMYGLWTAIIFFFLILITLPRGILFINILMVILFSAVIILYIKMWINLSLKIKQMKG